jgi:uncharacterized protein
VKEIKKYDIGIAKLSNKKHEYEFELGDEFFKIFEQNIINGGKLHAKVVMDKSELLINMAFEINGHVVLTCDRSLDEFDFPIDISENLRFRFGPENAELAEDLLQIVPETQTINIAQHLYDYILLSVPMKKLHPRFLTEDTDPEADSILIFSTKTGNDTDEEDNDDPGNDPRWDALKNISDN